MDHIRDNGFSGCFVCLVIPASDSTVFSLTGALKVNIVLIFQWLIKMLGIWQLMWPLRSAVYMYVCVSGFSKKRWEEFLYSVWGAGGRMCVQNLKSLKRGLFKWWYYYLWFCYLGWNCILSLKHTILAYNFEF